MSPGASRELRRCLWIFIASFFLTPAALWLVITGLLNRDHSFRRDYLDIYKDMFSFEPDMIFAWLIILAPVIIYEVAITCRQYFRHPEQLRSIFEFPRRNRK